MLSESDEKESCWATACWVGQEALADCSILHSPLKLRLWVLFNSQWQAHISCSDTSPVSDPTLNRRKAPTILSREVWNLFPLASLLCGARPVNPLKLSPTLSTLIFRTCDHENTLNNRVCFFFWISLFNDDKFHNSRFVGFLRLSTKGDEVCRWNIYPNRRSHLALNAVRLDHFTWPTCWSLLGQPLGVSWYDMDTSGECEMCLIWVWW